MSKFFSLTFVFIIGTISLFAQDQTVLRGKVLNADTGLPIQGVQIVLDASRLGTSTDIRGYFQLNISTQIKSKTLNLSCIGFIKRSVPISNFNNKREFVIKLSPSVEGLSEVVVTATGTSHRLESVPVRTEVIRGKQIELMGVSNVEETLSYVNPSLSFSPNAMGSFMKMNGLGNDYILVLVNGKRMYGDMGGNNDLNRIPLSNVKQIEVVKGASSSLYGSEAIAGVINIITKEPVFGVSAYNDTYIGAYGQLRQNNQVAFRSKKWSSTSTVQYKKSDGWQLSEYEKPSRKMIKKGKKDPVPTLAKASNAFDDRSFVQSFELKPNDKLSFRTTGSLYDKEVKYPVDYKSYNSYFTDMNLSVDGEYLLSDVAKLSFEGYFDNYKYKYRYNRKYNIAYNDNGESFQKTFYDGDVQLNTNQSLNSYNLKGVFTLPFQNTLNVGAEYMDEYLEAPYRFEGDKAEAFTTSIYAQNEWKYQFITLVGGLRWVNHEAFGSIICPKVSALIGNDWVKLRSSWGEGFKAPTLKELYYHYEKEGMGSHYLYLGNPDLKPQESKYVDASLEFRFKNVNFSISGYHNNVHNLINYKIIPNTDEADMLGVKITKQQVNIDEALTQGVDVAFDWTIGTHLKFSTGYSFVDAKDVETDFVLDGVSKHQATAQLAWLSHTKLVDFNYSIQGKGQSERYYGKEKVDGFMLWNFTTNHLVTFNKWRCNVKLGIDNLLDYTDDKPYGYHYSTLNPGRTYFAGVQLYFN
ncbi:TonB-dependent receptor [Halosquirtibacter laminarini]|uniref:TonB-dependent receptor n=1 Tax=Halosquirtibacter laminarini TaxID=3374600 RepID=A0AC61NJ84_9BACT|nr:TonB-dependent receptor [Prolixibacteraceae bacterium]